MYRLLQDFADDGDIIGLFIGYPFNLFIPRFKNKFGINRINTINSHFYFSGNRVPLINFRKR